MGDTHAVGAVAQPPHAEPFPGERTVTPEVVREHNLNEREYERILALLTSCSLRIIHCCQHAHECHDRNDHNNVVSHNECHTPFFRGAPLRIANEFKTIKYSGKCSLYNGLK